jgi:hypothetical protein
VALLGAAAPDTLCLLVDVITSCQVSMCVCEVCCSAYDVTHAVHRWRRGAGSARERDTAGHTRCLGACARCWMSV